MSISGSLAILSILALALALRLWGIRFGLPHLFHPDEWAIVDPVMTMLRTGDYNPHDFHYPTFYYYCEAVMFVFRFFLGVIKGEYQNINTVAIPGMYTWGRLLTALFGTANVFIVYKAGQKLFSRPVGIIAALFLAVSFLHVRDSHYITVDVPATMMATLSFLFACGIFQTGKMKYYILSGLTAGLAASTKWNAAIIIVSILAAHFLTQAKREPINGFLFAGLGAFIAGLYIGTPYAFRDPKDFFATVGPVFAHYSTGHPGYEAISPIIYYTKDIFSSEGASLPIALAGAAGLMISIFNHRAKDFFILAFPLLYLLSFANSTVTFPRNVLPIYPFIALYAAYAVCEISRFAKDRLRLDSDAKQLAAAGILALVLVIPGIIRCAEYGAGSMSESTRTKAGIWIDSHISKDAKLVTEFYAPPLDEEYDAMELAHIDAYPPGWFLRNGYDYIIFDSADYGRYFAEPRRYAENVSKYRKLFALGEFIKTWPADARVEPFLSPQIKILKIKKREI